MATVPAADATLAVLTYLASQTRPVAASRIAAAVELPRSTTYDLLGTLVARGFVIHYARERSYGLGPAAHELSSAYQRQAPLTIVGQRVAGALQVAVGESTHLAVLHGTDVLYVVERRAPGKPSLVTDVGVRLPAHLTASGRAILSALPVAQLRALYDRAVLVERTHGTGIGYSVARVLAEAKDTARRGYGVEDGDVTPGFSSVAVPILSRAGWPIAALAVTYESRQPQPDVEQLRSAAAEIARVLA